jgi:hypothetical protein
MTDIQNSNPDDIDVDPVTSFDQTNGLAGNLEGDDDGAEPAATPHGTLVGGMINHALNVPNDEEKSDEGYSEEGRP